MKTIKQKAFEYRDRKYIALIKENGEVWASRQDETHIETRMGEANTMDIELAITGIKSVVDFTWPGNWV